MCDIFISYANEDPAQAQVLAKVLEAKGWSTFWDRTIPIGGTWREVIGKELAQATCVMVLWSSASIDSGWVQEEAEDGQRRGILVPILIEDVLPPLGFRRIQAADLHDWDPTKTTPAFQRLVTDTAGLIQRAEEKRKQAEDRKRQRAEEATKREAEAAEARKAEEARKLEAEAAEVRKAEEARKREAEAAEARKAKEERKREVAATEARKREVAATEARKREAEAAEARKAEEAKRLEAEAAEARKAEEARRPSKELLSTIQRHTRDGMGVGIVIMVAGMWAMVAPFVTGLSVPIAVGVLLIASGVSRLFLAFRMGSLGHGLLMFSLGILSFVAGGYMVGRPGIALATLTLVLAAYFFVDGVYEIIWAFRLRPIKGWIWTLVSGIVALTLGIMIWRQFPVSGMWAVGTLAGIHMIFGGYSVVLVCGAARGAAKEAQAS